MNNKRNMDGSVCFKERKIESKITLDLRFEPANQVELKVLGDDLPDGYVAGWASTNDLDLYGHVVQTGAYDAAIKSRGLSGPRGIKLLAQHRMDKPAGVIKVLETRGKGLWIEAQMNLGISYVKDLYEAAKMNGGFSFSVGFSLPPGGYKWEKEGTPEEYLSIMVADLFEVSVVTLPGNEAAEMLYMKGADDAADPFKSIAELEKALVASGVVKNRNEAHNMVKLIKRNVHLFRVETPMLASTEVLTSMSVAIERLEKMFETN